jgi:hypothetical protein
MRGIMKEKIFPVLIAFLLLSCQTTEEKTIKNLRSIDAKRYENYRFDNQTRIKERILEAPDFLIDYINDMDNRKDYAPHAVQEHEKEEILAYIDKLPHEFQNVIEERLIGIYFIKNLLGAAIADYVLDSEGNVYATLMVNADILTKTLSEWMTYKENSCFRQNEEYSLTIESGNENAILYVLLHEFSHIYDYVKNVTPYVEPNMKALVKGIKEEFINGRWDDYSTIKKTIPFENGKVTFYGFGNGPLIDIRNGKEIYEALEKTPFATLYSTQNWAEDFAENNGWYIYGKVFHGKMVVTIKKDARVIYRKDLIKKILENPVEIVKEINKE